MSIAAYDTLYKQDTKGKVRIWFMEQDGNKYRSIAGLQDGQRVTSEWTVCSGKNIGRSNETTPEHQAWNEIQSHYDKKLRVDYHRTIGTIKEDKIFKPMLAAKWEDVMSKIDYRKQMVFIQPKLDGIRCIATKEGLFSRGGKPILGAPHIHEQLSPLFDSDPELILDGELYNHELKADFNAIVSMVKKAKPTAEALALSAKMVQYHVYDIPSCNENFSDRIQVLRDTIGAYSVHHERLQSIVVVETTEVYGQDDVDHDYGQFLADGYEGGIIRIDGPYEQKRSKTLLKRKDFEDAEFEIIRIEEGQGNWSGSAKRVIFRNDLTGEEVGAGLAGTYAEGKRILAEADDYVGKQVTIQFFTRTPDGVPRFPIAKVLHKTERL